MERTIFQSNQELSHYNTILSCEQNVGENNTVLENVYADYLRQHVKIQQTHTLGGYTYVNLQPFPHCEKVVSGDLSSRDYILFVVKLQNLASNTYCLFIFIRCLLTVLVYKYILVNVPSLQECYFLVATL